MIVFITNHKCICHDKVKTNGRLTGDTVLLAAHTILYYTYYTIRSCMFRMDHMIYLLPKIQWARKDDESGSVLWQRHPRVYSANMMSLVQNSQQE